MSDFADAIVRDILARATPAVRECAAECQAELREACSVPVGRTGRRVIRSRPGEAPRRETGGYVAGIGTETESESDRVRATVFTDDPRGQWFTEGTSRMRPRPHWREAAQRWALAAPQRVRDAMASGGNSPG